VLVVLGIGIWIGRRDRSAEVGAGIGKKLILFYNNI